MNSELEGYLDQLLSIRQDAPGLAAGLNAEQFNWRPATGRWSIGECFGHLNETARRFHPAIERAIDHARANGLTGAGPFAYPWIERFFVKILEPPPRVGMRTAKAFRPPPFATTADVMGEFMNWQDRFDLLFRAANGLDLRRIRLRSPFVSWFRYSLGTSIAAMLAHERRHIWQARQVRGAPGFPE